MDATPRASFAFWIRLPFVRFRGQSSCSSFVSFRLDNTHDCLMQQASPSSSEVSIDRREAGEGS